MSIEERVKKIVADQLGVKEDTVAADSATSSIVQYPTAGPSELMDVVELPITARSLPTTSTARK